MHAWVALFVCHSVYDCTVKLSPIPDARLKKKSSLTKSFKINVQVILNNETVVTLSFYCSLKLQIRNRLTISMDTVILYNLFLNIVQKGGSK